MTFFMKGRAADTAGDQSMHFWGICCESGKHYAQVVGQRFRITMAVLDPKSYSKEKNEKTVSLIVIRGGIEYLLCVLKHEEIHQVNLNLIFDKGEKVTFYINGHGKVYLSGYQLTDSEADVLNDENGFLCPLVEVTFSKCKPDRKGRTSKSPQNSTSELVTSNSEKKATGDNDLGPRGKRIKQNSGGILHNVSSKFEVFDSNYNSASDSDFCAADEQSESDDDSSEDYEDEEEEELEDEEIDEEYEEEEEEEEDDDTNFYSKGSQKKRKLLKQDQPQKRSRFDSDSTKPSAQGKSEDVISLGDSASKDSSDSDDLNSSIGNTPMPKRQISIEKKRSKKKKRLSEISLLSTKSGKGQLKSPEAESTPNRADNTVQKCEGGVEIQDVIIGKGPRAEVGKLVHVFYVGRLQDKQIFDSRLPGKKPFSFKLGAQQVIKGWDIGIVGMRVGGKRKLKIPPNMGYGNSAAARSIPPNSTLYFVVELQAVS